MCPICHISLDILFCVFQWSFNRVMVKIMGCRFNILWILLLLFTSCVTLDKSVKIFKPCFLFSFFFFHLCNRINRIKPGIKCDKACKITAGRILLSAGRFLRTGLSLLLLLLWVSCSWPLPSFHWNACFPSWPEVPFIYSWSLIF